MRTLPSTKLGVYLWVVPILLVISVQEKIYQGHYTNASSYHPPEQLNPDTANCYETIILTKPFDFVPVLKCQFEHPGIVTYAVPMFADIDGDGETEIVTTLDHSPNGFAIVNPHICEAELYIEVEEAINLKDGGPALGDVDNDGFVDIFFSAGTTIQRWEYDTTTNSMVEIWKTPRGVSLADRPHLDIVDLNQDGEPELFPNLGQMVNAVTGYVYPGTLPALNTEGKGLFSFTADAKPGAAPLGQGNVEVIQGTNIYRYDFTAEVWVKVDELSGFGWAETAAVAIADMDLDGDVDAVITQWSEVGQAVIWDLQTNNTLGGGIFDYPGRFGSRMNIANMDMDPYPEMVMTSFERIFAIDDIITTGGFGNIIWLDGTTDESGHTQLTSFDFDGDGSFEIAYRDETNIRIFSGLGDGRPSGGYPSSSLVLLDSGPETCLSLTGLEYPTIGDVDNDQEAEIVTTCNGTINIYESGSLPWGNASKVWNTQAFNLTNVNQDGTIPIVVEENYKTFNNFLAQENLNPDSDTIRKPLPDVYVNIREKMTDCAEIISFQIQICNQGSSDFPRGIPTAIYLGDPTLGNATLLDTIQLSKTLPAGQCLFLPTVELAIPNEMRPISVIVNDHGLLAQPFVLDKLENGGNFPVTFQNECDFTNNIDTFSLSGAFPITLELDAVICTGDTYAFNGDSLSTPGDYEARFTSSLGCDSTVILHLTNIDPKETIIDAQICEGENYIFGSNSYDQTGAYQETTISIETGCDSITTLYLEVLPPDFSTFSTSVCRGAFFEYNGEKYRSPGDYSVMLFNENGCDSIVSFSIENYPDNITTIRREICEGEVYTTSSGSYDEPGLYMEVFGDANGCDSLFNLDLIVNPKVETRLTASICADEQFPFFGSLLSASGIYTHTLQSAAGCDSTIILDLDVKPNPRTTVKAFICDRGAFNYNGTIYDDEGDFEVTFVAENGCDSLVDLTIIKKPPKVDSVAYEICEGEIFYIDGQAFSEPGIYNGIISINEGCDSIVKYQVAIYEAFESFESAQICQGERYEFQGRLYTQSGQYQHVYQTENGCDSIFNLNLTVNPISIVRKDTTICDGDLLIFANERITSTGSYYEIYENRFSCDSVVILEVEVLAADSLSSEDAIICFGEPVQLSVSGGNGQYFWQPGDGLSCTNCPSPIASPSQTTTYTVRSLGCKQRPISTTVEVLVDDLPIISLPDDFETPYGQNIFIRPKLENYNGQPIEWWINDKLFCPNCPNLEFFPNEAKYTVEARITGQGTCISSDKVEIDIREHCIDEDFFVPNMITPNGDGVNDEFYIESSLVIEILKLEIYDRWGELIFFTNSIREPWDGTYKGQIVKSDVYVYHILVSCPNEVEKTIIGNVTVIR